MLRTLSSWRVIALPLILCGAGVATPHPTARRAPAHDHQAAVAVVRHGLDAIGGENAWHRVRTLELWSRGVQFHVGDSEWPEGPYALDYLTVHEWRDLAGLRRSERTASSTMDTAAATSRRVTTLQGSTQYVTSGDTEVAVASLSPDTLALLLAPEHVLLAALEAPDLRVERDTVMRFVPHHVVSFRVAGHPARIFFEAETGFPRMVEVRRAFPTSVFWNAWGDVVERVRYTNWTREAGGILYPRQIDTERNGVPLSSVSIGAVGVNAQVPAGRLDVVARTNGGPPCGFSCQIADSLPLGVGGAGGTSATAADRGGHEIAPGVVQIVGGWNVTLVRQPDGVVVIEAPISAGYSRRVIEEAARRFPGLPVKAVVSTTDFWWHVAGLREYVARGIPVYVLGRNVRVVRDRAAAPHTLFPDSLARAPRDPIIRAVRGRTVLGSGDNRLELIPFHTEGLDRMMMVYLPGRRVLYTAEGVQLFGGRLWYPETAAEAMSAVRREGLVPESFIGMHVPRTPWTSLTTVLDSVARTN